MLLTVKAPVEALVVVGEPMASPMVYWPSPFLSTNSCTVAPGAITPLIDTVDTLVMASFLLTPVSEATTN